MPLRTGVYHKHGDLIQELRSKGYTLQEIADQVSVSRERIRQILDKRYSEIIRRSMSEAELAKVLGCSLTRLRGIRLKGFLSPERHGSKYIYSARESGKAARLLLFCPHCGKAKEKDRIGRKYCSECEALRKRNFFAFTDSKGKKRLAASQAKYRDRNPEKIKIINRKALKKHSEKKSRELWASRPVYRLTRKWYSPDRKYYLPAGALVVGIGVEKHKLLTKNGEAISFPVVKKIHDPALIEAARLGTKPAKKAKKHQAKPEQIRLKQIPRQHIRARWLARLNFTEKEIVRLLGCGKATVHRATRKNFPSRIRKRRRGSR